jgi:hypothetical protein
VDLNNFKIAEDLIAQAIATRPIITSSTAMHNYMWKFYERVWITNKDERTKHRWPSIPVKKIVNIKPIRQVQRNDITGEVILIFGDNSSTAISDIEYYKHMRKNHKQNKNIIQRRFRDVESYFMENC